MLLLKYATKKHWKGVKLLIIYYKIIVRSIFMSIKKWQNKCDICKKWNKNSNENRTCDDCFSELLMKDSD